ncbi:MAG: tetratricopeptide repeat protein [Lachnospiraceae bacterium]|nr:tetratricopeptide repeat protein [Lachnospiraceae bacterium]
MNCYVCNTIVDNEDTCPYCGADIKAYRMIEKCCAEAYNDGLQRARMRDLSGAIESLNRSLQYDKYNIDARNLLGLVYYEFGEPVQALREWVISKNLKSRDNLADYYLGEIQHGSGALDKLDQTVKKYNQAVEYCRQGNRDLARIQLKKVLGLNAKMVRARQLLALLYMQDGEYENARKELSEASKTDVKNPRTIRYMQEVRAILKEQNSTKKKKKHPTGNTYDYQTANDSVILPRQTLIETIDNVRGGLFNILIGLVLGLLVTIFLIVPNVRQNANSSAASALVEANEEAAGSASDVVALKAQLDNLQKKLENYEGKGDIKTSYEKLYAAQNLFNNEEYEKAYESLQEVNPELLETNGNAAYTMLTLAINEQIAALRYDEAKDAAREEDWNEAILKYEEVIAIDETYDEGQALYALGEAYQKAWQFDKAKATFEKVVETYPDTKLGRKAKRALEALEKGEMTEQTTEVSNRQTVETNRNEDAARGEQPAQNQQEAEVQPEPQTEETQQEEEEPATEEPTEEPATEEEAASEEDTGE